MKKKLKKLEIKKSNAIKGNCQDDKTEILQILGFCPITGPGFHNLALC